MGSASSPEIVVQMSSMESASSEEDLDAQLSMILNEQGVQEESHKDILKLPLRLKEIVLDGYQKMKHGELRTREVVRKSAPFEDLAQGVESAMESAGKRLELAGPTKSQLRFVMFCVAITAMVMCGVQAVAFSWWPECVKGVPCKYAKTQRQIFADVSHTRARAMKVYSNDASLSYIGEAKSEGPYQPTDATVDCVQPFVRGLKARVGNMTSQPEIVQELVRYFRLENTTAGRRVVGELWDTPVNFEPMIDRVATCARENQPLHEVLCAWLADPSIAPTFAEPHNAQGLPLDPNNTQGLLFSIHELMLLERFSLAGRSTQFRSFMASNVAADSTELEGKIVEHARTKVCPDNDTKVCPDTEDVVNFKIEKWNSIFMPDQESAFMDVHGGLPSHMIRQMHILLQLNILEASDIDRSVSVFDNANIGLTLAASVDKAVPYMEGNDFIFPFQKEWLDAYNVWNLNYVTNFQTLNLFPKLLTPSILCTSDADVRDHWFTSRGLTLKYSFLPVLAGLGNEDRRRMQEVVRFTLEQRRSSARVAARYVELKAPEKCCNFGTLYKLWQHVSPYPDGIQFGSNQLTNSQFALYFVLITWLAVVLAGLGSEVVLGQGIIAYIKNDKYGYAKWQYAQMIFSLLLTVSYITDGIGLFFLPFGLWKMGFPETVGALTSFQVAKKKRSPVAISELLNGLGCLLHHMSTSLVIVAVSLHLFPRSRAITAGCIVPIFQHLFVIVKYHSHMAYSVLMLVVETWFQIEVICNVADFDSGQGRFIDNIGRGLALSMLLAHYIYLAAG